MYIIKVYGKIEIYVGDGMVAYMPVGFCRFSFLKVEIGLYGCQSIFTQFNENNSEDMMAN